jgi:ribosome-binding factor A
MRKYRNLKMESLIRDELSLILLKEFEFPALVTLVKVNIDSDFKLAKIKIKVIPKDLKMNLVNQKKLEVKILKELNENKERLFKILFKKLNLKPMPKIVFEIEG